MYVTHIADVIKGVVCLDDGQFDAQEMGCVDVPVAALYDNPHWFSSQGALQNLTQLLSLQQISSVCGILVGIPVYVLHVHMYMTNHCMRCSERQDKATQHNRETTQLAQSSHFQSCLGWDSNL